MTPLTQKAWAIFNQSIAHYHRMDDVDAPMDNPFESKSFEALLYHKNWIDTVQWHLEDIIRDPQIDPIEALALKRRIDASNQERTDMVEYLDGWFWDQYQGVVPKDGAIFNTESPAWAMDRLSILALKVYHMQAEVDRTDAAEDHKAKCQEKLDVLLNQHVDLTTAIEQLLTEFEQGTKYMKVYKQMKMYNDADLNPILYQSKG